MHTRTRRAWIAPLAAALIAGGHAVAQQPAAQGETVTEPGNAALAASVKQELLRAPEAAGLDLRVEAKDGVVTLSGIVPGEPERLNAERIVRLSPGVRDVRNRITVRQPLDAAAREPLGNGVQIPRTSPVPATPGATGLPNGIPVPGAPQR